MQNVTAMLYCPNYNCQTPNSETHKFCQKCRTPLPRHYLWGVGEGTAAFHPGDLLADRYLCKGSRIFLDMKPGLGAEAIAEIPQAFLRYLRLTSYQLHIPQIYEILRQPTELLLLDQGAIHVSPTTADVQILPALHTEWQQASALRQLNWLWQIAQLWQPLSSEKTVSSLLMPEMLRVEGTLVRLLELSVDRVTSVPTLVQLGQQWAPWVADAQPAIAPFLEQLCQQLIQGAITSPEQLVALLDQGLIGIGAGQSRQIQVATLTDQGPTRQRNEDACYPPAGTVKTLTISANQTAVDPAIVMVCDGIGGHQGGNVASNLAIATVQQQLESIHAEQLDAASLSSVLENAVWSANDQISQRNDSEQRFDRQRMGTTLVMALVRAHELYTAHIGDSRAYWITRWSCRQVTLDDDIASREVRLGYSSYREALQQPGSGSLVQALGMGSSNALYPTVQRFVLDEDCVFLLCSDGLSDNDRVDEYWDTEILPLLDGKTDLATVSQRLVAIANTRNGHDNVTVGLVYCQVSQQQHPSLKVPLPTEATRSPVQINAVVQQPAATSPATPPPSTRAIQSPSSTLKTQIVQPNSAKPGALPLLLSILVLLGLGGLLAYFLFPSVGSLIDPYLGLARPKVEPPTASVTSSPAVVPPLQVGAFIQVSANDPDPNPPILFVEPASASVSPSVSPNGIDGKTIPAGSVLQVLSRQGTSPQDRWVQVRICVAPDNSNMTKTPITLTATPGAATPSAAVPVPPPVIRLPILKPRETGWVQEATVASRIVSSTSLSAEQQGICSEPPVPVSPPVTPSPARSVTPAS
jgi:serine/threonine protein phosphatase PrpC